MVVHVARSLDYWAFCSRKNNIGNGHLHTRRGWEKLSLRDIVRLESETYYKNSDFYWSRGVE